MRARFSVSRWILWALLFISACTGLTMYQLSWAHKPGVADLLPATVHERLEASLRRSSTMLPSAAAVEGSANAEEDVQERSMVDSEEPNLGDAGEDLQVLQDVDTAFAAADPRTLADLIAAAPTQAPNATVSAAAVARAWAMRSPFLKHYEKALGSGLASELMADPFADPRPGVASDASEDASLSEQQSLPESPPIEVASQGAMAAAEGKPLMEYMDQIRRQAKHGCAFQEGVDYVGSDVTQWPPTGLSSTACCERCRKMNRQRAGSCTVAVLSAKTDDPPEACWLKTAVTKAVPKDGVVSCLPSSQGDVGDHQKHPRHPLSMRGRVHVKHGQKTGFGRRR